MIIAHRGASHRFPENTLAAFDAALDGDPSCGLELDLQISRDGVVHVLHDETVDRTTDGTGPLRAMDADRIAGLDAGHRFRGPEGDHPHRGRGMRIPRLDEVLRRYPSSWMSLDLKRGGLAVEDAVVRRLEEEPRPERCVVGSEHAPCARRLRQRLPPRAGHFFDRRSALLFYLRHRTRLWWGYRPPGRYLQIPFRARGLGLDHPRLIADAHRQGLFVVYWTVNGEEEMERLLDAGADGLMTDHPERLRDLLTRRGTA